MKKETQQLVLMLIIGILLGMVGTELWLKRSNTRVVSAPNDEKVTTTEKMASTSELVEKENEVKTSTVIASGPELPQAKGIPANIRTGLTVNDQAAGKSVLLKSFKLDGAHWIAVYDEREGKLGWIMGAKRFLADETIGAIALLRSTEAGKRYYVAIHNDDGNTNFDWKTTDPLPAGDDAIIVSFVAQ